MTMRAEFIAAMQPMSCNYDERSQKFTDAGINLAWFAWQAARSTTLEEAAAVCEKLESRISKAMEDAHERSGSPIDGGYLSACDDCADLIRALAKTEGGST